MGGGHGGAMGAGAGMGAGMGCMSAQQHTEHMKMMDEQMARMPGGHCMRG